MKEVISLHGGPSCTPADITALYREKRNTRPRLFSGSVGGALEEMEREEEEDQRLSIDSAQGNQPVNLVGTRLLFSFIQSGMHIQRPLRA